MKKLIVIIIIAIILPLVFVYGYYKIFSPVDKFSYKFVIIIEPEEEHEFEIYIPLLKNIFNHQSVENKYTFDNTLDIENHPISPIMYELEIVGNASYEIIETIHGDALKIIGNNRVRLHTEGENEISIAWLNMIENLSKGAYPDYWVYGNISSNSTVQFMERSNIYHNRVDQNSRGYISSIRGEIKNDWQLVEGRRGLYIE